MLSELWCGREEVASIVSACKGVDWALSKTGCLPDEAVEMILWGSVHKDVRTYVCIYNHS